MPLDEPWKRKRTSSKNKPNQGSNQNFEEQFLTIFQASSQEDEDRSFLESLLPTLRLFNNDQKLLFRSKIIQTMMDIKQQRTVTNIYEPYSYNSQNYHNNITMSQVPVTLTSTSSTFVLTDLSTSTYI